MGAGVVCGVGDAEGGEEIGDGDAFGGGEIFVFDESRDALSFEEGLVEGDLGEIAFAEEFFHVGVGCELRGSCCN